MRLGNDRQVVKNISKLLSEKKLKKQVIADANALLSETYLNLEEKDSAVTALKIAQKFTKLNTEKTRYRFILGQLYQESAKKDSAVFWYQSVIDMNRNAERKFVIQAYAKKAQLFDYQNGDKATFIKTYNKLVDDRENRPFLDIIYYEMGVFYDKNKDQKLAYDFYNASLKANSSDAYLVASNYRNLGNIHFRNAEYLVAAKYYDSTLTKLDVKTREYIHIKKTRKDLDEVIEYESIAKRNDSILTVVALSETDRKLYFEKHIEEQKKSDKARLLLEEKQKTITENRDRNNITSSDDPAPTTPGAAPRRKLAMAPPSATNAIIQGAANDFYFYNPSTVAFGKVQFKKKWGNRPLGGNWRLPANKTEGIVSDTINNKTETEIQLVEAKTDERYTVDYYENQLPKTQVEIDSIAKERNFAYLQLGIIYKEKFKEYGLASNKLEQLLQQNPEEKLILPSMYNLYKIYQITNSPKEIEMKNRITSQYPNSRYAQIINNSNSVSTIETPEDVYNKLYKLFQEQQFVTVLNKIDELIIQFSGDEIVPKFELLKANAIGKLKGLEAYKNAMQFVADNYSNSEEGKNAQDILTTQIPTLYKIEFSTVDTKKWMILYKIPALNKKISESLEAKIKKFIADENNKALNLITDNYTETEMFIAINGINSEEFAKNIVLKLKENEKYKIQESAIVLTNENYKIVQIKKNLEKYQPLKKP